MIPESTLQTINDYVEHGTPPGDFVRAVLENNLTESFGRADINNRSAMFEICCYLYNRIPSEVWGNPEKVSKWLKYKMEDSLRKEND